jgi:DsbC/DsbD-like thiol-disulfide interchange protein
MKIKAWVGILAASFTFAACADIAAPPAQKRTTQSSKKTLDPTKDDLVFKGSSVGAKLKVEVAEGFHIQANPAKPRLIPTTLKLEEKGGLKIADVTYPTGKPYKLKGSSDEISVYEGEVEVSFKVSADATAKPGPHELGGTLRYQACNDITCFFPKTVPVKVLVTVN